MKFKKSLDGFHNRRDFITMGIKGERIRELESGSLMGRMRGLAGGSPKGTFITNMPLCMS